MKQIKTNIRKIMICMALSVMSICTVFPVRAATYEFGGSLNYRVLDGSENNKFYDVIPNRGLSISGTVSCNSCFSSSQHINTTYILCMEGKPSGKGTEICTATVEVGIDESEDFYASGTPKTSQCYMYTHKIEDDGYNLDIDGKITQ